MKPPENLPEDSQDENSNDGLQIVLESPRPKRKLKKELNESDKEIIASIENIDETLDEKAAKAHLTAKNVKSILKHVVMNEEVLGLLKAAENPEIDEPVTTYEPKLTRAKTKEFLSKSATVSTVLPWAAPPKKKPSEVEVLFTEELQEDSSGDEYVPEQQKEADESIEEQLNTSQISEISERDEEEEANIALRTRSKLCLSHTPLEAIEEAFIPPDITTDMYDMDCDDDVWRDFLKTFTRPLDEVAKATEDEDHDPEYNILADEEIDKVDREELRADRAVTIPKKEVNNLIAELFEYADIYASNRLKSAEKPSEPEVPEKESETSSNQTVQESDPDNDPDVVIKKQHIPILAQQMRQHVQMLTQNFLLTYKHPEFGEMAEEFKDCLISWKGASLGKPNSMFQTINLDAALKLIDDWENLFASDSQEVKEAKLHTDKIIVESIEARLAGNFYVPTFPRLVMDTIAKSEVFMYPNLLPRIPFKPQKAASSPLYYFTNGEINLIALFFEQHVPQLKQDSYHLNKYKRINFEHVCFFLHKYLMSHVPLKKLERYVRRMNQKPEDNPIKYYYRNKCAPPIVHYVTPIDPNNILPPCKRSFHSLPLQWREHIYEGVKEQEQPQNNVTPPPIIVATPIIYLPVSRPPVYSVGYGKKIAPKGKLAKQATCVRLKRKRTLQSKKRLVRESKILDIRVSNCDIDNSDMLPDMPSLGTPVKNQGQSVDSTSANKDAEKVSSTTNEAVEANRELSFENISRYDCKFYKPESTPARRNFEGVAELSRSSPSTSSDVVTSTSLEKDNPDDINELMIASSTVKNKKEPSGAEKKRAKIRKEFLANLNMATPELPEVEFQKEDNMAERYYEKIRDTLDLDEYNKLIEILGHFDEKNGKFRDLYDNVQSILLPKYKELSDEFLLFLTDIQAHMVGQLMPYFFVKDMSRFIKKLQVYFKDQPTQLKKIIKAITDIADNPDATLEVMKSSVLPLLKGNMVLTDWFLQIFHTERPPRILDTGAYEVLDIKKELTRPPDEKIYETIAVPDREDPYGGPSCICDCHTGENPQLHHCTKCGLKFINGKMFIQTGKALRPAVVSFITNPDKDHTKRLSAPQRKRADGSPNKQTTSPNKDEDNKNNSHESEEDGDGTRKKTRKRQRNSRAKAKDPKTMEKSKNSAAKAPKTASKKRTRKKTVNKKKPVPEDEVKETKPGSSAGQQKRLADDSLDGQAEFVELKVSSDHSGESESEFFESSQDITNTESEDSNLSAVPQTNGSGSAAPWTREEDKAILQAFQQGSGSDDTFKRVSKMLQNRSEAEVKNRFHRLMSLLQEMTSK